MSGSSAVRKIETAIADEEAPAEEGGRSELPAAGRRSRRKRQVRARTVAIKQMRKDELRLGAQLFPPQPHWRPQTHGECRGLERPCPFVGCKHHLYLDVSPRGGIKFNFPDLEVWQLEETCALDVAERPGGVTLEEVGAIMNLTRERIRQLEAIGLKRLEDAGLLELLDERRIAAKVGEAQCRRSRRVDEGDGEAALRRVAGGESSD